MPLKKKPAVGDNPFQAGYYDLELKKVFEPRVEVPPPPQGVQFRKCKKTKYPRYSIDDVWCGELSHCTCKDQCCYCRHLYELACEDDGSFENVD